MGFYDNYRSRVQDTLTDTDYINEENKRYVIEHFFEQPNYYQVTKNFDLDTTYDVLIAEESKKKDSVGIKNLISYPYATPQFTLGDYINWQSDVWLLTTLDTQYDYSVVGRIIETNTDLKWINNNGVLKSYRAIATNKVIHQGLDETKYITVPDGNIIVRVQKNDDTSALKESRRFIINGNAYRITNINNFVNNMIEFYMEQTTVSDEDDLINNIADQSANVFSLEINADDFNQVVGYISTLTATVKLNGDIVTKDVLWSTSNPSIVAVSSGGIISLLAEGSATITCSMQDNSSISDTIIITVTDSSAPSVETRILPNEKIILQSQTQVYTVYKYIDNVVQADTFNFTTSGIASSKYEFTVISGNSFSVRNIQKDDSNQLTVLCTNLVDATTATIQITLGGLW